MDLLVLVDPAMYFLGFFQVITGMCIFFSLFFLLYAVLIRWTNLLNFTLFCQQTFILICIVIMASVLVSRYPSLKTDEAILNNAMSGYGKNFTVTKLVDTTQRELKCCGVYGYADWKKVNATLLVNSISYEFALKAEGRVPVSCTTIKEARVQLHTGGCLVPFFAYKEHFVDGLFYNMNILVFFEIIILLLVGSILITEESNEDIEESNEVILVLLIDGILADYMASDAVANAEHKQKEDIPSIYTLDAVFSPMPVHVDV